MILRYSQSNLLASSPHLTFLCLLSYGRTQDPLLMIAQQQGTGLGSPTLSGPGMSGYYLSLRKRQERASSSAFTSGAPLSSACIRSLFLKRPFKFKASCSCSRPLYLPQFFNCQFILSFFIFYASSPTTASSVHLCYRYNVPLCISGGKLPYAGLCLCVRVLSGRGRWRWGDGQVVTYPEEPTQRTNNAQSHINHPWDQLH